MATLFLLNYWATKFNSLACKFYLYVHQFYLWEYFLILSRLDSLGQIKNYACRFDKHASFISECFHNGAGCFDFVINIECIYV